MAMVIDSMQWIEVCAKQSDGRFPTISAGFVRIDCDDTANVMYGTKH